MFVSGVCVCVFLSCFKWVFVIRDWKALPSCGEARVFFFRRLHGCRVKTLGLNNGWIWFVFWCRVMQSTVDKLIKKTNLALVVGTNSWREQFMEAITVSAGNVIRSERAVKPKLYFSMRCYMWLCMTIKAKGMFSKMQSQAIYLLCVFLCNYLT